MLNVLPLKDAHKSANPPPNLNVWAPSRSTLIPQPPTSPDGHPLARPGSTFGARCLPHPPTPSLSTATARCQRCRDEPVRGLEGNCGSARKASSLGRSFKEGRPALSGASEPNGERGFQIIWGPGGGSPPPSDLLLGGPAPARAPRLPRRACLRLLEPSLQPSRRRPQHRPRPEGLTTARA